MSSFGNKLAAVFITFLLGACVGGGGSGTAMAPVQDGAGGGTALDSAGAVGQSPQSGNPLGGDANNSAAGAGNPGGQPTESGHIAPKLIELDGEVCFSTAGEPDCDSPFTDGTLTFSAFEGGLSDDSFRPENTPVVVAPDGTFSQQTGYYLKEGVCQTRVRYFARYTTANLTYVGRLTSESCLLDSHQPVLKVLLEQDFNPVMPDMEAGGLLSR